MFHQNQCFSNGSKTKTLYWKKPSKVVFWRKIDQFQKGTLNMQRLKRFYIQNISSKEKKEKRFHFIGFWSKEERLLLKIHFPFSEKKVLCNFWNCTRSNKQRRVQRQKPKPAYAEALKQWHLKYRENGSNSNLVTPYAVNNKSIKMKKINLWGNSLLSSDKIRTPALYFSDESVTILLLRHFFKKMTTC